MVFINTAFRTFYPYISTIKLLKSQEEMLGHQIPVVTKPSRSDHVLDPLDQLQIADQVRTHFDSLLPYRPPKPNRSDPDSNPPPPPANGVFIPELEKLRSLRSQLQPVFSNGVTIDEEFVETSYYEELIAIDKHHHTTGTGFIRVVQEDDHNDDSPKIQRNGVMKMVSLGLKGNPAMNDWTPSFEDDQAYVSSNTSKPIRSG